jgi:NADH-quinone oxidoreductase subunit N
MSVIDFSQLLRLVAPEAILVIAALLVLTIDLMVIRKSTIRSRFLAGVSLASIGCAASIYWIGTASRPATFLGGMLVTMPLTNLVQIALIALAILTLWITADSTFTEHVGEYILLVLFATSGMMFLVASQNILLIFIALELLSLSLYALAAFNKKSPRSAEGGLKYFLFGGMSAAFLLFGFSLFYGMSGSTNLAEIAIAVGGSPLDPLALVAIVMTAAGLGFKVAAVPFHLWAPDVYEGAPAQSAAFIASSSKVASFFILAQVILIGLAGAGGHAGWSSHRPGWLPVIEVMAAASMVLGNLAAIVQTSVRRLLAYSAIGHAGYMLLGILPQSRQGLSALLFYVTTYALTTIGAFAVVSVVEEKCGEDKLANFAGLSRRAPLLSICMMIFLLSLAGVPPLVGFFGKFYLFASALSGGSGMRDMLWLVVLAIAMSAVSLYYYLQVLKRIYVATPIEGSGAIRVPGITQFVTCLLAVLVLALGCAPQLLLALIQGAMQ